MNGIHNHKFEVHTWIAILTFVIFLMTTFGSVVAVKTNVEADISINSHELKAHKDVIQTLTETIHRHETRIVTIETNYNHIKSSLERIEDNLEAIK